MSLNTENLAIVMTGIAGYTEAARSQSRRDHERLLASHNAVLLPIVRRYRGRHIKSTGAGMLLVFRSPTDAMLCAMAVQDALFEYNRNAGKEQQIHVRIAASLGEVRVTRSDVFGEAVNITSRIEGITPPDEIYLSEAVYMAMNKAEVPAQEAGWRELKGVAAPIRVFNIPRFSTPRLVPQDVMAAEDMSDLVYPYGGAHLARPGSDGGWREHLALPALAGSTRARAALVAGLVLVPATLLAMHYGRARIEARTAVTPSADTAPARAPQQQVLAAREPRPSISPGDAATTSARAPRETIAERRAADHPAVDGYTRFSDAKRAYRARQLSKRDYRRIAEELEDAMDREIDQVKRDYRAERISKREYRERVEAIKNRYE